jgi:transposase
LPAGRLRQKLKELEAALEGCVEEHHRFLMAKQLSRIEAIEADLGALDARLRDKLLPYDAQLGLLIQIPGVDWVIAATIIAEIGVDMSLFLGADYLAAWAGMCPGSHESAGKRRHGGTRKGNIYLRTALVTAAIAAAKTRGTYLKDKYHSLRARRGAMRAAVAIGHKILVAVYHMLSTASDYKDLGPTYLDTLRKKRTTANLVRRLNEMGYDVALQPKAA